MAITQAQDQPGDTFEKLRVSCDGTTVWYRWQGEEVEVTRYDVLNLDRQWWHAPEETITKWIVANKLARRWNARGGERANLAPIPRHLSLVPRSVSAPTPVALAALTYLQRVSDDIVTALGLPLEPVEPET